MVAFSAEIRAAIDAEGYFNQIEERYRRCMELKASDVERDDTSLVANVPLKIATVLQIGLRRALMLTESFVADVNARRFPAALESAEELLDTANVLKDCQLRVEQIMERMDISAITALDDLGMDAFIRSKSPGGGHPERYEAMHPNPFRIVNGINPEHLKTVICSVALGLLITITVIERYNGIRTDFSRLREDLQAKCHGRCNN